MPFLFAFTWNISIKIGLKNPALQLFTNGTTSFHVQSTVKMATITLSKIVPSLTHSLFTIWTVPYRALNKAAVKMQQTEFRQYSATRNSSSTNYDLPWPNQYESYKLCNKLKAYKYKSIKINVLI